MASTQLSPGVKVIERDFSERVTSVSSSSAALVGYSEKGDVDNIILITSSQQFIQEYGEPDPTTGSYFHYSGLAYLAQGNVLYSLRVVNGALYGGVNIMSSTSSESNAALGTGQSTKTITITSGFETDVVFQILGKDPGTWNNKIGIKIQNVLDGTATEPTDQYTFEIVVEHQDDDGNWSQVELWKVSRKRKVDGYGKQLYMEDRINGFSSYISVADNSSNLADTVLPKTQSTRLVFTGGTNGSAISSSDLITGWDEFTNPEDVDVRILINGGETAVAVQSKLNTIANARKDCVAIQDMPSGSIGSVADMLTFRTTTQNFNSSYSAIYTPWVKIYDQFNDRLLNVPPSGYVAAQLAYNDYVGYPWTAAMGFTRGVLDVIEPSYIFTEGERDLLFQDEINPIQMFRGEGTVIWGQRTEQVKRSALSDLNVRRSLIVIEKAIGISLRPFIGENNTVVTRFRISSILEQYLDRLSAQGAFQTEAGDRGFRVVCDDSNNIPSVIDNNEILVHVFVKPVKTIYFVQLIVPITQTGISFEELISRGVLF